MSGGHFNYRNDDACREIYGWGIDVNYGERGFEQSRIARKLNPLEDKLISELVWDVFCLLHSYDWYASGDCREETYREDVEYFKKKWFGKGIPEKRLREIVDDECAVLKQELYKAFGVGERRVCPLNVTSNHKGGGTGIEELELSVRSYNCLKRAHIDTVEHLMILPDDELMKVKNLGVGCVKEIKEKLEAFIGEGTVER